MTHPRTTAGALLAAALSAPLVALASPAAEVRAQIGAGACGGSVGCVQSVDLWNQQAQANSSVGQSLGNSLSDGSYADASGLATIGQLHAYADAHRAPNTSLSGPIIVGDAQSSAQTDFIDYVLPGANNPNIGYANYTLNLAVNGSHTATDNAYPNAITALAYVSWNVSDNVTGTTFASGYWESSDAQPSAALAVAINGSNPSHLLRIDVELNAYAYVMSNNNPAVLTAVVDYKDTLDATLTALTPGASTVGVSGHDFAAPVPEPASAALLLAGGGVLAWRCRQRALPKR